MRRMPVFALLGLAAIAAACDTASPPTVAGIAPAVTTPIVVVTPRLVIIPSTLTVGIGATIQLQTNAPANLVNQVEWNTLNGTVATVSPSGLVRTVGLGTAVITARFSFDTTNSAAAVINVTQFGPTVVTSSAARQ